MSDTDAHTPTPEATPDPERAPHGPMEDGAASSAPGSIPPKSAPTAEAQAISSPDPVSSAGAAPIPAPPLAPSFFARVALRGRDYFLVEPFGFLQALAPLLLVSVVLYTRMPTTNYIFDEQEALLANPYVNATGKLRFIDAIHRDFWGLPPDHSVGSYRPIPDFLWRALWHVSKHPFFHSFYNVAFHAINAALLAWIVWRLSKRRELAWLSGFIFVACAVLTEAVSGIVGIADVLGGMGALLALAALELPALAMPFAVFASVLFGLFCKESELVCVPLVPFAALVLAPLSHPSKPRRALRMLLAALGAASAFVLYVELRRRWFPSPLPEELKTELPATAGKAQRLFRAFLVWFHQAPLPKDPLNNPLATADAPHRIAGALRVYLRGLGQIVFPKTLSGDYSFPSEPIPDQVVNPSSLAGAALTVLPLVGGAALWIVGLVREARLRRAARAVQGERAALPVLHDGVPFEFAGALLAGVGLVWIVVSYFPHSNIPVVLPTVRAERFWYFPAIGSSIALAVGFVWLHRTLRARGLRWVAPGLVAAFLLFQAGSAYRHAMDYRDDLAFWEATKNAVPDSAKAHLNYSVMKGARGDLNTRLGESKIAMELAPKWPMARIYTGDTLCRMHRAAEAWPYYAKGFELGPNEQSLIALALQCLWDEHELAKHDAELRKIADSNPRSWIAYLAIDTLENGETNKGVDPKYRPRGYNEGPKDGE